MELRVVVVAVVVGCSGGKPKVVEDARSAHHGDATQHPAARVGYRVDPKIEKGDVQIRVEWKDVPTVARASSSFTACGTPRAASVAPTTTWGIPDVLVVIGVDHGKPFDPPRPRVVLEQCALAPRVTIAGTTLAIASATEAPAKLALAKTGQLPLGGDALTTTPRPVYLPIAGHEVEVALEPGVHTLQIEGDSEAAIIVAAEMPYLAITDATGQVVLRDVPTGTHAVTAWLPPRAQQPARIAQGKVTVAAGALSEVTVDLTKP